jgi:16S rRNA (cytosine967-C5)-methyltransferase
MLENARDIAVRALRDRTGNISAHVKRLAGGGLPATEGALAVELALGSLRRRSALETVLRAFLAQPNKRLPRPLAEILHVGLYQILYLERVPDFAAVNEAVSQTVRLRHKRQSGLVNGLLRNVLRSVSDRQEGRPPLEENVLPVGPNSYRTFDRPVFPDPAVDPEGYLAVAYSLPLTLASRWIREQRSLEGAAQVALHSNARPPLILRVNTLRCDLEGARASLLEDGVQTRPHCNGVSLVVSGGDPVPLTEMKAFHEGLIQPQDPTATAVPLVAAVKPGMRVLDFCASPGTKTTAMAALMNNRGSITATDVSDEKLRPIDESCLRLGVTIVSTRLSSTAGSLEAQSFDVVLADVPCSNSGVLARRAEARWRFNDQRLGTLVGDQKFIAQASAGFVRPGGRLVYSTCSIEPEEGREIARWLTRRCPKLRLEYEELTMPGGADDPTSWHDGGYVAVFTA